MVSKIEQALVLVAHAAQLRNQIGDHGDQYEDTLQKGGVTSELKMSVREIVATLRDALDHAAWHMAEICSPIPIHERVQFIIAGQGVTKNDFRPLMHQSIPQILQRKPALAAAYESAQAFASPKNAWLMHLAAMENDKAIESLIVVEMKCDALISKTVNDKDSVSLVDSDGQRILISGPSLVKDWSELDQGSLTIIQVHVADIDRELLTFLDVAIVGTNEIVRKLSAEF